MTDYMYAYNPCSSFILAAPKGSDNDCLDDVAVSFCMSVQNITRQGIKVKSFYA